MGGQDGSVSLYVIVQSVCVIGVLLLNAPRCACGECLGFSPSYHTVLIIHDLHSRVAVTNDVSVKLPERVAEFSASSYRGLIELGHAIGRLTVT